MARLGEGWQACATCGRYILQAGTSYQIEAAWDKDGAAGAVRFLEEQLAKNLDAAATLADRMKVYADEGVLKIPGELNTLDFDLEEFKGGVLRLVFYRSDANCGPPVLRVTHGFRKRTQRTPLKQMDIGRAIAKIDRLT